MDRMRACVSWSRRYAKSPVEVTAGAAKNRAWILSRGGSM
jgi:hypothetical protein